MKKFQVLGKTLTRDEQKKIIGGNVVCISCSGGDTLCAGSSNWTCRDTGYSAIMCGNMATGEIKHYTCAQQ